MATSTPDLQSVDFKALIEKHNDEELDIEQHFSPQEFREICDYEKSRLKNVKRNYLMLIELGIAARKPDFMQKDPRVRRPYVTKSEHDSDAEWIPTCEGRKSGSKASKRKKSWNPPLKEGQKQPKLSMRAKCNGDQVEKRDQAGQNPVKVKANSSSSGKKTSLAKVKMSAALQVCFMEEEEDEPFNGFTQSDIDQSQKWSEKRVKDNALLISQIENDLVKFEEETEEEAEETADMVEEERHVPEEEEEGDPDKEPPEEGSGRKSRYPRRDITRINYKEERLLRDDDYIYCDDCGREHVGDCPIHGPLIAVADTKVPNDGSDVIRAVHSLPKGIAVRTSHIPGAGEGVWAEEHLQKGLRFGPYEGIEVTDSVAAHKSGYCWLIYQDGEVISHYIDAQYQRFANWLRFVNCARYEEEQNLQAYQYQGEVYYRTIKPISSGTELLVWYGEAYAKELGISEEKSEIHALYKNAGLEVWECGVCERIYPSERWMLNHRRHHGDRTGSKRYKCDLCTYSTDHRGNMVDHKLTHTGEKPYTCSVCGKRFTLRSNLVAHKAIHTGERKYPCTVCDYRATLAVTLRDHMRTHTGEQPYTCTVCDYRTAQAGHLRRHMRTHTGEQPYTCTVCDYRTAQAGYLRTHMRTHTGEKPYTCTVCDYRTAHAGHLRTHMKTYSHAPFTCEHCTFIAISQDNLTQHMRKHNQVRTQRITEE